MKLQKKYILLKSNWRGEDFEKYSTHDTEEGALELMNSFAETTSSDWKIEVVYVSKKPADML